MMLSTLKDISIPFESLRRTGGKVEPDIVYAGIPDGVFRSDLANSRCFNSEESTFSDKMMWFIQSDLKVLGNI